MLPQHVSNIVNNKSQGLYYGMTAQIIINLLIVKSLYINFLDKRLTLVRQQVGVYDVIIRNKSHLAVNNGEYW